jgi:hypothetical protein
MALTVNSTYSGEVLTAFVTKAVVGNDTVDKGSIRVQSGIQHKYTIPTLGIGNIIQRRKATPVSPTDSKGDFAIGERQLTPEDFMVYTEFNPRDLEEFWGFAQPDGNLVFRTLDSQVQVALVGELMKELNRYLGQAIWHGVSHDNAPAGTIGGTPTGGTTLGDGALGLDEFNGLMIRILQDKKELAAAAQPILAGNTEITNTTEILAAMNGVFNAIPKSLRGDSGLKILLDWELFDLYDQALIESNFKHADYTETNVQRFRGIKVVPTNGVPTSTIVAGVCTSGTDSNLWFGVDYVNDSEVLQVEKVQANSELYFMKMLLKADTVVAKPSELVYHTTYTLVA